MEIYISFSRDGPGFVEESGLPRGHRFPKEKNLREARPPSSNADTILLALISSEKQVC